MEWIIQLLEVCGFRYPLEPPADRNLGAGARGLGAGTGEEGQPTSLDLWLIECIYEAIATESTCGKCGAPLRLRLHVMPALVDRPLLHWHVSVVTRCAGRRRHRHLANVVEGSKSLLFGPLCPS
ncbi:MAG: hypothetical protein ABSD97_16230 [Acidimicrobiales bacterium]|jgi:hypothetical protein